jgi:diguanylate cyclase (GGDEF)-like protein
MTLIAPFEELYRQAPCGLVVTTADGVITEANDTILAWLGTERHGFVGSRLIDHLDSGSQLFYETRHAPVLALQGEVREVSLTMVRSDATTLAVLVNSTVRGDAGDVHTAIFDASARVEYERELLSARRLAESSEMRVRVLQASSSAFVSSTTEEQICGALLASASEAFSATATGVFLLDDEGEYVLTAGAHPLEGLLPPSAPRASDAAILEDKTITVSVRDEDGPYADLVAALRQRRLDSVSVIPLLRSGVPIGVLACFFARSQDFDAEFADLQAALSRQAAQAIVRVRLQRELERLALHDQLTGLANRKLLLETVTMAVERAVLTQRPLSVVFLDLDGFKGINDQLGHAAGDSVLEQVAARIRNGVRYEDAVGRYGGDEFVAVCEDADLEAAASVAARIRELVAAPLDGLPAAYSVTASVGVAVYTPGDGAQPTNDELLSLADSAMYLAKSAGKDRVSFLHR